MKLKTRVTLILLIFISMAIMTNTAFAQEWSTEQKEVWSAVESWWKLYQDNDVSGIQALFHEDYKGWTWGDVAPEGRAEALKWAGHAIPKNKIAYTNLRPLEILLIDDNIAVLHYFFYTRQSVDGKDVIRQGRWTDVWKKEEGKWLLIADSGGEFSSN